jgi:acyl-homoserine lactone synthase
MIRVIEQSNRTAFAQSLDAVFRLRHDCFVKERGWRAFDKDGLREQDQYDDAHAVYLAALGDGDELLGCLRLYPTLRPHMLSEIFSHLVDGEVPRAADIVEMTRLAIRPGQRGSQTYDELLIGVQEYCISRGIAHVTGVVRALRMPMVQAKGYQLRPLGEVKAIDDDPTVAVIFDTNPAFLDSIRRRAGIRTPVLEDLRETTMPMSA